MIIIFLGNNKEFLSSFAQNIEDVETIIVSSINLELIPQRFKYIQQETSIVICDLNSIHNSFNQAIQLMQQTFPGSQYWALFESRSTLLKNEVSRIGFQRIISYRDDFKRIMRETIPELRKNGKLNYN